MFDQIQYKMLETTYLAYTFIRQKSWHEKQRPKHFFPLSVLVWQTQLIHYCLVKEARKKTQTSISSMHATRAMLYRIKKPLSEEEEARLKTSYPSLPHDLSWKQHMGNFCRLSNILSGSSNPIQATRSSITLQSYGRKVGKVC